MSQQRQLILADFSLSDEPFLPLDVKGKGEEKAEVAEEVQALEEIPILCRNCGHIITSLSLQITINGQYYLQFQNPMNITFEITCFKDAPGTTIQGDREFQYSWFPGFSWQYCHCASCQIHLGWFYLSGVSFYGLIVKRLIGF
ncbi:MAG: hypothetical protein H7A25_16385 [Leptospiraceae bacterium]|nr:hypothetical protein [Leptospiraceae bacterium]MCP5501481.1 hypothetical protein [Leptospiraceae bacterium]